MQLRKGMAIKEVLADKLGLSWRFHRTTLSGERLALSLHITEFTVSNLGLAPDVSVFVCPSRNVPVGTVN
jgi:hypothetical protein